MRKTIAMFLAMGLVAGASLWSGASAHHREGHNPPGQAKKGGDPTCGYGIEGPDDPATTEEENPDIHVIDSEAYHSFAYNEPNEVIRAITGDNSGVGSFDFARFTTHAPSCATLTYSLTIHADSATDPNVNDKWPGQPGNGTTTILFGDQDCDSSGTCSSDRSDDVTFDDDDPRACFVVSVSTSDGTVVDRTPDSGCTEISGYLNTSGGASSYR